MTAAALSDLPVPFIIAEEGAKLQQQVGASCFAATPRQEASDTQGGTRRTMEGPINGKLSWELRGACGEEGPAGCE